MSDHSRFLSFAASLAAVLGAAPLGAPAIAQEVLPAAERAQIDSVVTDLLSRTEAPSASIAIVRDGALVYERAYGTARLLPETPASSSRRYAIGSVSKQFTAAAVLLLAERGHLSLDDRVARWLPDLTRADEITVRQLLSMTSGYQDYWPHDYVFPAMREPTEPEAILDRWARKPLDFDPGTRWQYSNTNYVIAGRIVEQVTGLPFMDFVRDEILEPLGLTSVCDFDGGPLGDEDAAAYLRNALGPLRPAPKEAPGWLFAAGGLAMTAGDLAVWDLAMIEQSLLSPASWREMQTEVRLESGLATGYGLGVGIGRVDGRRRIAHGGAVSGYSTSNQVFPDERTAVVALVNVWPGAAGPSARIADAVARVVFGEERSVDAEALAQARRVFADLQRGEIDRSLLSQNANAYFTDEVLGDFARTLGPLGEPDEFVQAAESLRGGMTFRAYRLGFDDLRLLITTRILPDGKIEQYQAERAAN